MFSTLALTLIATLEGGGVFRTVKTPECKLFTDISEHDVEAVTTRIGEFGTTCAAYFETFGLSARNNNDVAVRLYANHDEFDVFCERVSGATRQHAIWSDVFNSVVTYHDPNDSFLNARIFARCANVYLWRYIAAPPEWLRRGFEAVFRGYDVTPGEPVEKGLPLCELVALQGALRTGDYVPLEELLKRTPERFEDKPANVKSRAEGALLANAQAWSLVHYFTELAPPAEKDVFLRFLEKLNAKGAKADSAKLEIRDWAKFERGWSQAMLAVDAQLDTAAKHMRVADGYVDLTAFALSLPEYEAAYALDKKLPGFRYKFGAALKYAGDYKTAVWWLERASEEDPTSPLPHHLLSRTHTALDWKGGADTRPAADPAKALEHAQKAVELGGEDSALYVAWLGRCQALTGDKKAAVATLKKAILLADKDDKQKYEKYLAEAQKAK